MIKRGLGNEWMYWMCVSYNVLDGTQKRMTRVIINIIISSANTMTQTHMLIRVYCTDSPCCYCAMPFAPVFLPLTVGLRLLVERL